MSHGQQKGIHILRTLYRELRPSVKDPQKHVYQTDVWKYVIRQCRQCQSNPSTLEETSKMMRRVGEYYTESIRGTREYLRIYRHYKGEGERSPKDLAAILGFRMPDEPKITDLNPTSPLAGDKYNKNKKS